MISGCHLHLHVARYRERSNQGECSLRPPCVQRSVTATTDERWLSIWMVWWWATYQESAACYRVTTQIWSREEHALSRRDVLDNEVRLITRFYSVNMYHRCGDDIISCCDELCCCCYVLWHRVSYWKCETHTSSLCARAYIVWVLSHVHVYRLLHVHVCQVCIIPLHVHEHVQYIDDWPYTCPVKHTCCLWHLCRCGIRGGYMQIVGLDDRVMEQLFKHVSVSLCPNTPGQVCTCTYTVWVWVGLLWGTVAQRSGHLWLKQEGLCSIPGRFPEFSSLPAGFLTFILCGAIVQFGCYQHRYV